MLDDKIDEVADPPCWQLILKVFEQRVGVKNNKNYIKARSNAEVLTDAVFDTLLLQFGVHFFCFPYRSQGHHESLPRGFKRAMDFYWFSGPPPR